MIAEGEKFVENRTWETMYRGPLAIHAGKGTQYMTAKQLKAYATGAIIAIADLVDCVHALQTQSQRLTPEELLRVRQHKHFEGPFGWVLKNVKRLKNPIVLSGTQGLWDVRLPYSQDLSLAVERDEVYQIEWPAA